jgi:hypothetical protein
MDSGLESRRIDEMKVKLLQSGHDYPSIIRTATHDVFMNVKNAVSKARDSAAPTGLPNAQTTLALRPANARHGLLPPSVLERLSASGTR